MELLMEHKSKVKWILIILAIVLLFAVTVFFLMDRKLTSEELSYDLELLYKDANGEYEVRVYHEGGVYLYQDGKRVKTLTLIPKKINSALMLPEETESLNIITDRKPVSDLTWNSTISESAKFLNFLYSQGYSPKIEVNTSQFIEKFLVKDDTVLRVVIFNNTLMVGEMDTGAVLPSLENYLKYDLSGGLK